MFVAKLLLLVGKVIRLTKMKDADNRLRLLAHHKP